MTGADRRIRRPKDKDQLMQRFLDEGPFEALRDVLVFAAALGYANDKRVELSALGEPIRYEVATNRYGTDSLVNMLAVAAAEEGAEVLAEEHFDARIRVFEEYANGGLAILQERINRGGTCVTVADGLVNDALGTDSPAGAPDLGKLADELGWGG
jgi:dnd system-associated protein 4